MARSASSADLPAIAEIYAHYVMTSVATFEVESPGVDEWIRRFTAIVDAGLPFLVAEREGAVAAYAYCGPWKSRPAYRATVEISVYVAPRLLGRGCGSELMAALLESCHAVDIREVIAVIADSGDPSSVALHGKFGFVDAGRLTGVGFKHDRWIDTVLMQRTLV